ncbi:hypothetical protein ACFLZI_00165, partial [Nitrospirota bacterium]
GGKSDGLTLLSGFVYLNIGTEIGKDFKDTLGRVKAQMDELKEDYLGLGDYPGFGMFFNVVPYVLGKWVGQWIFSRPKRKNELVPSFTNTGIITDEGVNFGDANATEAWITPSLTLSGKYGMVVCASTFRERINLNIGCVGSSEEHDIADKVLDEMVRQLGECG